MGTNILLQLGLLFVREGEREQEREGESKRERERGRIFDLRMMEFDFLNVGGKESGGSAEEENRGSRDDAAFSVSSAMPWPLLDNASTLQQCMPFKTLQEQKPKTVLFNPISATEFSHFSAFEAFESNQKAHTKYFDLNMHIVQQFAIHASTPHVNDVRFSSVLHPFIPITKTDPFSEVKCSSSSHNLFGATINYQPSGSHVLKNTSLVESEVETFFPRKILKPATTSAQLTIFYAGSVNVYDDVPCDKAQDVLLLASELHSRAEAQATPITEWSALGHLGVAQTPKMARSHVVLSDLSNSNTLSLASHIGSQPYVPTADKVGEKTMEISSQTDPSKAMNASMGAVTAAILLPIAVPQARKASLARFLEKRKERASSSMPYSCDKKGLR